MGKITDLSVEKQSLKTSQTYVKNAIVEARKGIPGETIITVLKNGFEETKRTVGDEPLMVITNPDGEQYAIKEEDFVKKYFHLQGDKWQAKGKIKAIQLNNHNNVTIIAPWGEEQHGVKGCWLAMNLDNPEDIYIIGEAEFTETYRKEN